MVAPVKLNFKIYQGSTFNEVLRWESTNIIYKSINSINNGAPVVINALGHGCPVGWRVKVTNVLGMKEINSDTKYSVVTDSTLDSVTINSLNSSAYSVYASGGLLQYNQPTDLTGFTARMQVRLKLTSEDTILSLTTENGGIALDNQSGTITINISSVDTTLLDFKSGVYSLEMVKSGVVTPFIVGTVTLIKEVTR